MRKEASMIRNLKFLGLALVAALAMSSVVASMASADVITSESGGVTTVSGSQEGTDVFKVDEGEVKCSNVTYSGSFNSGESSGLVTPAYSGCTFVGLIATIDMNSCQYRVNVTGGASTEGSIDIVCPGTNEITVTAPAGVPKCVIHIPAQTDRTQVTGTNVGSGTTRELTLDININNIKYSKTSGSAETGNCKTADNTTGGEYIGKATVTGFSGSAHVGIFLS
jgi:hypothetical protein